MERFSIPEFSDALNSLIVWRHAASLRDSLASYYDEWLGRRCDGSSGFQCGTILWEATREFCIDPKNHEEQRTVLLKLLRATHSISDHAPNFKSIYSTVGAIAKRSVADELVKWQHGLFFAQIYSAETAMLLSDESSSPGQLIECLNFTAKHFAISQGTTWRNVNADNVDFVVGESPSSRFGKLMGAMWAGCQGTNASPIEIDVRKVLVQVERSVGWILGQDRTNAKTRELIIPLVGSRKLDPKRKQVEEFGSLAFLRVKKFDPLVATAGLDPRQQENSKPILLPDPVSRGLLAFDEVWHTHFDHAVAWAAASSGGVLNNSVLLYDVDFWFSSLANNLKRFPTVKGASASLAAALLARATFEQTDINREACVTGKIANDSGNLGTIAGVLQKVDGYQDILTKHYRNSLFLAGPTEDKDEEVINTLNQIDGFPGIQRIDSVDAAFDRVIGEVDLVRIYAAVELHRVSGQVERFVPARLQQQFNRGLSAKCLEISDLSILDELTMEQTVVEDFARPEKESSPKAVEIAVMHLMNYYFNSPANRSSRLLSNCWVDLEWERHGQDFAGS